MQYLPMLPNSIPRASWPCFLYVGQKGKTQDFQVTSTRVDLGSPKRGNMCKILKTCGPDLSFAKSLSPLSGLSVGGLF